MPRPAKGSPEAKACGEKMKAKREAKHQLTEPDLTTAQLPVEPEIVGAEAEVVGAKLSVDISEIKSMLESITEDSEVDIYNPLDQGFRVQFTITAYQSVALSPQERDVREKAGMPYEKDMGQTLGHAVKFTVLPPHKVTRLPGKVAHVAIKQLRNYIMRQDRDNYADVADPAAMREYEEKIVMRISSPLDNMNNEAQNEIERKIAEMNVGV